MEERKHVSHFLRAAALLGAAVLLLAVDIVAKRCVLRYLKPTEPITLIDGLLELSYVENTGAAFGLFKNMMWLVVLITVIAVAAILVLLFRYQKHTFFSYASSALLIAGGIGNLLDRILYGFVVDYIHVLFFDYIFNFADCCVTVGAVLFVIHVLLISLREKRMQEQEETKPSASDNAE